MGLSLITSMSVHLQTSLATRGFLLRPNYPAGSSPHVPKPHPEEISSSSPARWEGTGSPRAEEQPVQAKQGDKWMYSLLLRSQSVCKELFFRGQFCS